MQTRKLSLTLILLVTFFFFANAQNLKSFKDPGGKFGFSQAGKTVIKPSYVAVYEFSESLAGVTLTGKPKSMLNIIVGGWGFINASGKVVVPLKYDQVQPFYKGLAAVKLNGKCGFIDQTGKEVVPLIYDELTEFSEGLMAVRLGEKWGFINEKGEIVIEPAYDGTSMSFGILNLYRFVNGEARVEVAGKRKYIDKYGMNKSVPGLKIAFLSLLADAKSNFDGAVGKLIKQEGNTQFYQSKIFMQLNLKLATSYFSKEGNFYTSTTKFSPTVYSAEDLKTIKAQLVEVIDQVVARNSSFALKRESKADNGDVIVEMLEKSTDTPLVYLVENTKGLALYVGAKYLLW